MYFVENQLRQANIIFYIYSAILNVHVHIFVYIHMYNTHPKSKSIWFYLLFYNCVVGY